MRTWLRLRAQGPVVAARVEAAMARGQDLQGRLQVARGWRPGWWVAGGHWWSSSRLRPALSWWLAAWEGCWERLNGRLPRWWPERLTGLALAAVLLALARAGWWLPS